MISRALQIVLLSMVLFAGCAGYANKIITSNDKDHEFDLAKNIKTIRGDIWVHMQTPKRQLGFSAQTWMKLDQEHGDLLRMEISGPFGTEIGVIVLYFDQKLKKSVLVWKDVEHGNTETYVEYWYDIPLKSLAHVLCGVPMSFESGEWNDKTKSWSSNQGFWQFDQHWEMNGRFSRPVLASIDAHEIQSKQAKRSIHVDYRETERYGDFFLPTEIDLSSSLGILLNVTWRTRYWNESLPAEAFIPGELENNGK